MNQAPSCFPSTAVDPCPGGIATPFWSDDLENISSGNWASSAISGINEWYYPPAINPYAFDATFTTSGTKNFWGINTSIVSDYVMAMTNDVAVPANAILEFNHFYMFEYNGSNTYDGGVLEYSKDAGNAWLDMGSLMILNGYDGTIDNGFSNPLGGRSAFTGHSIAYKTTRVDLSSLAGENIRIRFRIGTDVIVFDYGWFIDDINFYTCNAGTQTPLIVSVPVTTATENQFYFYDVDAVDSNGNTLTYSLTESPQGMSINASNGLLAWTPNGSQAGNHPVTVSVSDGIGGVHTPNFLLVVSPAVTIQTLSVYADAGIPAETDIFTWSGDVPNSTWDDLVDASAPEGTKVLRTISPSWAGWGVFKVTGALLDMSTFTQGYLSFLGKKYGAIEIRTRRFGRNQID